MNETLFIYLLVSVGLVTIGLRGAFLSQSTVDRLMAINILGAGLFLLLIAAAYRSVDSALGVPDPVPHALVLTGIVVAISATALGLALSRALTQKERNAAREGDEHGH